MEEEVKEHQAKLAPPLDNVLEGKKLLLFAEHLKDICSPDKYAVEDMIHAPRDVACHRQSANVALRRLRAFIYFPEKAR